MYNSPEKYYFCDKLRFDIASFLFNNFDICWFTKGGLSIHSLIGKKLIITQGFNFGRSQILPKGWILWRPGLLIRWIQGLRRSIISIFIIIAQVWIFTSLRKCHLNWNSVLTFDINFKLSYFTISSIEIVIFELILSRKILPALFL